jgi:hypothetical protein
MVSLDSADWTACRCRRLYAATFPPAAGTQPARRPAPWHPDWIRLHAGPVEAFTRSRRRRDEAHIRTSTWQYHLRHLLYHRASLWCMMPIQNFERLVSQQTPEHLRSGWRWILTRGRQGTEGDAERTAIWVAEHGTRLGFRPPNVQKSSAALGLTELDAHLGLTKEERDSPRKATPWTQPRCSAG